MLDDAVALHRAGRLPEAAAAYEQVLQAHPHHADAWQLLGLVRHRLGDAPAALAALDEALALEPEHAPAWANRGLVLRALDRADDAAVSFRRAADLREGFREPLLNLLRLKAARGDLAGARTTAEEALRHHPEDPEALRLAGLIRAQTGDLVGAVQAWGAALGQAPDPGLAMGLGQALLQLGRPDDAVAPLAFAVTGGAPAHALFADATLQARQHPAGLDAALLATLDHEGIDHQRLERAIRQRLGGLTDEELLAHPLFVPWLSRCLVSHPTDLARLDALRDELVTQALSGAPPPLSAVCALATQAWLTEHGSAPPGGPPGLLALPTGDLRTALGALFRPLPLDTPRPDAGPLRTLWEATVAPTLDERARAETIPVLALGADEVSEQVRAMYEANPYPRRVGVHRPPPVPLDTTLAAFGLSAPPRRPLKVLVAGAGTGQHPLQTATRYADVEVLGVDLSRRSLARAQRVAAAHGITNVRFAQGDLLELGNLPDRFDVIESVGVLHHLSDPLRGWAVLRERLAPDGVMRIGLYAERGRADVVSARALVAEWGLGDAPDDLREARRRLLALPPEHPARPVVHSPDFPSLSGLRDLVFHVCEHRYTLDRLQRELDALGLGFAGFQHTLPEAAQRYRARWPDDAAQQDLSRWDELEAEHPRLFSGMYVFWCAPVGGAAWSGPIPTPRG